MSWKRPNPEARMLPLVEVIPKTSNGLWLDAGSGEGLFARILNTHLPKLTILKIDKQRFPDLKQYRVISYIEHLPLRPNCLDGMVLGQILHYIPHEDQIELIEKLSLLLGLGGFILIVEYNVTDVYPWIPFPIHIQQFKEKISSLDRLEYIQEKHIPDGRRPKFSLLLKRI